MRRLFLVSLLLVATTAARAQQSFPERPLPLDPLTPAERERAVAIARENPRVQEFLAGRTRLIYADFLAVKDDPRSEEPVRRHADVLFYGYDSNTGLRALVDLEAGRVVGTARVAGNSVPITEEEIAEAAEIALGSSAVRRLLGDRTFQFTRDRRIENRIGGLRTLGAGPDDPCTRGRCIELFFRTGERGRNRFLFIHQVVVDLRTREVMVLPPPAAPPHHQ